MSKLMIGQGTTLVIASVKVKGVHTHSEKVRDEKDGAARETERNTTQRITHEGQYLLAKRVTNQIRAAVDKFTINTLLGNLTQGERLEGLRARMAELKREIDTHNTNNPLHMVRLDFQTVPIGMSLTAENQAALCAEVQEALAEVKGYLLAGDFAEARLWLNRRKHLSALMPAIVGQVVEDAIGCAKESAASIAKVVKEKGEAEAAPFAATLDLSPIDAAINWTLAPEAAPADQSAVH